MPRKDRSVQEKDLDEIVSELGLFPIDAFNFVQQGLAWTVEKVHGPDPKSPPPVEPGTRQGGAAGAKGPASGPRRATPAGESPRHISGKQLCEGLRMYAIEQWGMMAGVVLRRWNLRATVDFGRIVFALVDGGHMHKTERDTLDDFRDVYDFDRAFDGGAYTIGTRP